MFHRDTVHLVITQAVFTLFFKTAFRRQDKVPHQRLHPLHHDNELITVLIHEMDVFFTEVSTVKNETCLPVSISLCL